VEHGVHFFDIINALGGQKYNEVFGISHKRNETQRDRVSAMVLYEDGLIADYYHAFSGPGFFEQTTIHLAYDLARIEIEGWMPMKGTVKALVNSQSRDTFKSLPEWNEISSEVIGSNGDESRPEGWGTAEEKSGQKNGFIKAGGISYKADHMITGTFEIQLTKGEVYGKCVQEILTDVIQKIEDKDHKLKITIEDGTKALKIALLASK
jgi:predicted dehydrogenase